MPSGLDDVIARIDALISEEAQENSLLDVMGNYRTESAESYAGAYEFSVGDPPSFEL